MSDTTKCRYAEIYQNVKELVGKLTRYRIYRWSSAVFCSFMLCNELTNFRNKINRNLHNCGSQWIKGSLVFSDRFLFSLCFVMSENSKNALFVPTFWKF